MKHAQLNFRKGFRVLNVYVPPAYGKNGDPLPRGKK
jgi:hypothetical protein